MELLSPHRGAVSGTRCSRAGAWPDKRAARGRSVRHEATGSALARWRSHFLKPLGASGSSEAFGQGAGPGPAGVTGPPQPLHIPPECAGDPLFRDPGPGSDGDPSPRVGQWSPEEEPACGATIPWRATAPLARAGPKRIPHRQRFKSNGVAWEWPGACNIYVRLNGRCTQKSERRHGEVPPVSWSTSFDIPATRCILYGPSIVRDRHLRG